MYQRELLLEMPDNRPRAGEDSVWEVQVQREHLLEEPGGFMLILSMELLEPLPTVAHNALPN